MIEKRILILGILVLFLILLWWIERLYNKNVFTPSKVQMPAPKNTHEDLMIKGKHVRIFPELGDDLWVMFCHGSNGNLSHRQYMVEMCRRFKFNLCLFDYPGYGLSEGNPSPGGLHSASQEVFRWLTQEKEIKPQNLVIWGESLGGNPATMLASENSVRALVLFSTFSSLPDILTDQVGWWSKLMGNVCKVVMEPLPTKSLISKVRCPVVIVHSREDTIIPYSNAWKLYQAISHSQKCLIPIAGDHALPQILPRSQVALFNILRESDRIDADELIKLREQLEEIQERLQDTDFYHQRYTLPKISLQNDGFVLTRDS